MCGLVWSTLYLGYLPDRYIIILLLRLPYVLDWRSAFYDLFICLKVDCVYMIGQMSVHHVYLLNYLLSSVLVKSGQYVICFCVYELINIDILFTVWYSSATSTSDSMRAKANDIAGSRDGKRSNPSNKRGNDKKKATNEMRYVNLSVIGSVVIFVT